MLRTRGLLSEEERQHLFELLGIALVLRVDPVGCPPSTEAATLGRAITREIERLQNELDEVLIERDKRDQQRAIGGLDRSLPPDAETRRLRSDPGRAQRRLNNARLLWDWVRQGGSAAGLFDPESGEPATNLSVVAAAVRAARAEARTEAPMKAQPQTNRSILNTRRAFRRRRGPLTGWGGRRAAMRRGTVTERWSAPACNQ